MFGALLSWVASGGLSGITKALQQAYEARLRAQTDSEKLATDLKIRQLEGELQIAQNAKEVRLATAGFWEMRVFTFFIALPFVVHVNLVGADTNFKLGWGIPAFPSPFDEWEGAILLSFFGIYTLGKGLGAIAHAVGRKR